MATIGNVSTMYLKSSDALGTDYETNISKGFFINPSATYEQIDTAARAIAALSTNTYKDTNLVTNISVNEEIAGGGDAEISPSTVSGTTTNNSSPYGTIPTFIQNFQVSGGKVEAVTIKTMTGDSSVFIKGPVTVVSAGNGASVTWYYWDNVEFPTGTTKTITGIVLFIIDGESYEVPYTVSRVF